MPTFAENDKLMQDLNRPEAKIIKNLIYVWRLRNIKKYTVLTQVVQSIQKKKEKNPPKTQKPVILSHNLAICL